MALELALPSRFQSWFNFLVPWLPRASRAIYAVIIQRLKQSAGKREKKVRERAPTYWQFFTARTARDISPYYKTKISHTVAPRPAPAPLLSPRHSTRESLMVSLECHHLPPPLVPLSPPPNSPTFFLNPPLQPLLVIFRPPPSRPCRFMSPACDVKFMHNFSNDPVDTGASTERRVLPIWDTFNVRGGVVYAAQT